MPLPHLTTRSTVRCRWNDIPGIRPRNRWAVSVPSTFSDTFGPILHPACRLGNGLRGRTSIRWSVTAGNQRPGARLVPPIRGTSTHRQQCWSNTRCLSRAVMVPGRSVETSSTVLVWLVPLQAGCLNRLADFPRQIGRFVWQGRDRTCVDSAICRRWCRWSEELAAIDSDRGCRTGRSRGRTMPV